LLAFLFVRKHFPKRKFPNSKVTETKRLLRCAKKIIIKILFFFPIKYPGYNDSTGLKFLIFVINYQTMKKVILALAFVFAISLMLGINRVNASTLPRSEIQKHKSPPKPISHPKSKGHRKPSPTHTPKHSSKHPWG
jgi:hypothetical protein